MNWKINDKYFSFFIVTSNLSVYYIQSPQETQNPPAATPLYCESSLELSWNHLIYDYKAYQTTSFEFKALPLPLSSYQSMISTADAVLTPENGH